MRETDPVERARLERKATEARRRCRVAATVNVLNGGLLMWLSFFGPAVGAVFAGVAFIVGVIAVFAGVGFGFLSLLLTWWNVEY